MNIDRSKAGHSRLLARTGICRAVALDKSCFMAQKSLSGIRNS